MSYVAKPCWMSSCLPRQLITWLITDLVITWKIIRGTQVSQNKISSGKRSGKNVDLVLEFLFFSVLDMSFMQWNALHHLTYCLFNSVRPKLTLILSNDMPELTNLSFSSIYSSWWKWYCHKYGLLRISIAFCQLWYAFICKKTLSKLIFTANSFQYPFPTSSWTLVLF